MKTISLSIILFLSALLAACSSGDNQNANQQGGPGGRFGGFGGFGGGGRVTSVEVREVEPTTISKQVRAYGNIKSQDIVAILPQVSNRITKIHVDLGDTVRQGQIMAKIYDVTFRDQLEQAKAQVLQARTALNRDSTQFARQKQLFDRDLISASEFEIAQATFQNSRAQLETALSNLTTSQENFNNTEIRSPVRGVVVSRSVAAGDIASAGTPVFEVANLTGYETRIFLPVQDWREIKIGQEVTMRVSNETSVTARGVVSRISPQIDPITGLGEVVISLNEKNSTIYPGVLVESRVNIITKQNVLTVPRSALVETVKTIIEPESNSIQLDRTYSVYVSVGDSVAERRELQLGIEQGDRLEVLAGLREGDKIIITGQNTLEDGGKIRVSGATQFQAPQGIDIGQNGQRPQGTFGGNGGGQQRPGGAQGQRGGFQQGAGGANLPDSTRQRLLEERRRQFANGDSTQRRQFQRNNN